MWVIGPVLLVIAVSILLMPGYRSCLAASIAWVVLLGGLAVVAADPFSRMIGLPVALVGIVLVTAVAAFKAFLLERRSAPVRPPQPLFERPFSDRLASIKPMKRLDDEEPR